MTESSRNHSFLSDTDARFRRGSIMSAFPLLANAPSIQKLSLKHLPTIDSKRFMKVLDNLVTRVLLVSSFPTIVNKLQEFSLMLGRNATVLFESFGPLSKAYDELCATSGGRDRFLDQNGAEIRSIPQQILQRQSYFTFDEKASLSSEPQNQYLSCKAQLASNLFDVTRLLLCELINNPVAISSLIRHREQWGIEPAIGSRLLAIHLIHLRSLTRNDLLTTPKARARRDDFIDRLRRRDMEQKRTMEELTNQMAEQQEVQKIQMAIRLERIKDIHSRIKQIQEQTQARLNELRQKYYDAKQTEYQKHSEAMKVLQSYLVSSNNHLHQLHASNAENEWKVRTEKWKMEDEIQSQVNKADAELFEMRAEYDTLYEEEQNEKKACDMLTERLEPLTILANAVLEEKRLEAERKAAEIIEQENIIRAATIIQSLYRSWKVRRMIRSERRKKKGRR